MTILKGLRELDTSFDQLALKGKIVDLMDQILEVGIALQDAKEALDVQRKEIAALKADESKREDSIITDGYRYDHGGNEDAGPKGAPCCPGCDIVDDILIQTSYAPKGCLSPQCKTSCWDAQSYPW